MFFRNNKLFIAIIIALLGLSFSSLYDEKTLSYSEEHFVGARSDCPAFQDADTLQLNPSGPFALPAHQSVVFQSIIKDSSNNVINADPLWGATNGTIISSSGFGQATFVPHSTGQVTVWACVDGINTTASVTVVQGSTDQLILESNVDNLSADDKAIFSLTKIDIKGNTAPANAPLGNWTLPEGSDLDLDTMEWTPKYAGNHIISVEFDGLVSTIQINVTYGVGVQANIVSSKSTLSSDENLEISLELIDSSGNKWIVEGDWSFTDPGASQNWLEKNGTEVVFDAHTAGNWVIQATYSGNYSDVVLTDLHTFSVTPGELFQIVISGNGATITVDDELDLNPKMYDYDMNELTGIPITWEVNGEVKTIDLESSNFVFSSQYIGQYEIQALAGDKYSSISFDVIYGTPTTLQITGEESSAIVVRTGEEALVYVEAVDQYGNSFPVDVEWQYSDNSGKFDPSSRGSGWYLFTPGDLQGFILFNATYENITHGFIVDVQQGIASQLLISFKGDLVVGNSVEVTVYAIDSAGSKIAECDSTSITGNPSSTAGKFTIEDNSLALELDESGQQHSITITCLGMEETTFFDVQSSLFGGAFGSSNSAILILSFFVMCIIGILLFVIVRRSKEVYYDEDEYDDESEPESAPPALVFTPPPPHNNTQTNALIPPPIQQPIPPAIQQQTQPPIQQLSQPVVPPQVTPATNSLHSSVGQGLVAPISPEESPQMAGGVWIQPQTSYGWNEKQSSMFVNEPALGGYGWEENKAPLPSSPESKLSGALSALITSDETSDIKDDEEVEHEIQKSVETETPEKAEVSSETEDGDGWGSWNSDDWGSQEWKDKAKERVELESKKDDYDRGLSKTKSMPIFEHVIGGRDDVGPLDEFGKVMSPLPGTNVGTSGWYLGSDGTPSQWEFRPQGWKKLQ